MEKIGLIGITGYKGFIGSNFLKYLKSRNVAFTCFEGDLCDIEVVEKFFQSNDIQTLVHTAGTFAPPFGHLLDSNVRTTFNLLSACSKFRIKKIIYLSSAAVYGEPIDEYSLENDELAPNTEYGLSKMFAEKTIEYYHKLSNIEYVILRFTSVYGKNEGMGVLDKLIADILKTKTVTIFGDGTQKRNFLHVDDACQAIFKSLFYNGSGIFNISSTTSITLNEIIRMLKDKYDFIVKHKPVNNNLKNISLDISLAKLKLGYNPKYIELQL